MAGDEPAALDGAALPAWHESRKLEVASMVRGRAMRSIGPREVACESQATRSRRSRRACESQATRSPSGGASRRAALAMTSACAAAAMGFDLCASRTRDETISVAASSAAVYLRSLQKRAVAAARSAGVDARPRARTCDRLRWEWLASTASMLDRTPDRRLVDECARVLSEVDLTLLSWLPERIHARYCLALAEAHSLASAIEQIQTTQPVFAYAL